MTQHTARVLAVQSPRAIPDTDHNQAAEVLLEGGVSIWLPLDGALPPDDVEVTWEGHAVSWPGGSARKIGNSFPTGRSVGGALY